MDGIPGSFTSGTGAFAPEDSDSRMGIGVDLHYVRGLLEILSDRLAQCLFLVSAKGTILGAAGTGQFAGDEPVLGTRWTALWPRESRPLAQGALQAAVSGDREVTIEVLRMPDAQKSAQCWQALLSPLPMAPSRVPVPGTSAVLITLTEVTAAKGVAYLKARTL